MITENQLEQLCHDWFREGVVTTPTASTLHALYGMEGNT